MNLKDEKMELEAMEDNATASMDYDEWYKTFSEDLMARYIEDNPEDFPTDESMQEIEQNNNFNDWVEEEFNK